MSRLAKISLLLILVSQGLAGQKLVNSPYSRFGPGTLEPQGLLRSRAMGGAGSALRDPTMLNYQNPASYSSLDTNSFVFDFGLDYQILTLNDGTGSYKSDDINFHHLVMGFPLSKRAGLVFGLVPYSSGYYNIASYIEAGDPDWDPLVGEIENRHKGTGGYNKYFMGLGVSPIKNLSLGVNIELLAGTINRQNTYYFLDGTNYYNLSSVESILLKGYNFNFGAQYNVALSNNYFAGAALTLTPKRNYKIDYESLLATYSVFSGSTLSTDTLDYSFINNSSALMPQSMTIGLALGQKDKISIAIDYTLTNWSDSKFPGYEDYLINSNSLNIGIEYIPNKLANTNLLKRVEYRLGGHTSESQLLINGEQIKDFGITFGVGLPMNRTKSKINLFMEYGQRKGSFENGLHSETYYNFGLSFNFYDNWFEKVKYN